MTDIIKTISDLDRLHAEAKPGTWSKSENGVCGTWGTVFHVTPQFTDRGSMRGVDADLITALVNAYHALRSHIAELEAKVKRYEDALNEIKLGEGPYNRNPLTHADNCIQAMKTLAEAALAAKEANRG